MVMEIKRRPNNVSKKLFRMRKHRLIWLSLVIHILLICVIWAKPCSYIQVRQQISEDHLIIHLLLLSLMRKSIVNLFILTEFGNSAEWQTHSFTLIRILYKTEMLFD